MQNCVPPHPLRNLSEQEVLQIINDARFAAPPDSGIQDAEWTRTLASVRQNLFVLDLNLPFDDNNPLVENDVCQRIDTQIRAEKTELEPFLNDPVVQTVREEIGLRIYIRIGIASRTKTRFSQFIDKIKEQHGKFSLELLSCGGNRYLFSGICARIRLVFLHFGRHPARQKLAWSLIEEFLSQQAEMQVEIAEAAPILRPGRILPQADKLAAKSAPLPPEPPAPPPPEPLAAPLPEPLAPPPQRPRKKSESAEKKPAKSARAKKNETQQFVTDALLEEMPEYQEMMVIQQTADSFPKLEPAEEQTLFKEYIQQKILILTALLEYPDVIRAAGLLCMPLRYLSEEEQNPGILFGFQRFLSMYFTMQTENILDRFSVNAREIKTGKRNLKETDGLLKAVVNGTEQNGESAEDDEAEFGVRPTDIAALVRKYVILYLDAIKSQTSTAHRQIAAAECKRQIGELLMQLGSSPAMLRALAKFYPFPAHLEEHFNALLKLRERIILPHMRNAAFTASFFARKGFDPKTCYQYGVLGLLRAIDRHDSRHQRRFYIYCREPIHAAISSGISAETHHTGSYSMNRANFLVRVKRARSAALTQFNDDSAERIAQLLDVPIARVEDALQQLRTNKMESLSAPFDDEDQNGFSWEDSGRASTDETPEELMADIEVGTDCHDEFNQQEMRATLIDICQHAGLTRREQNVIMLHYLQDQPLTLEEIGARESKLVTRARIQQLDKNAIAKMRRYAEEHGINLDDFPFLLPKV